MKLKKICDINSTFKLNKNDNIEELNFDIRKKLKSISEMANNLKADTKQEEEFVKNIKSSILKKTNDIASDYRKIQTKYIQEKKTVNEKQAKAKRMYVDEDTEFLDTLTFEKESIAEYEHLTNAQVKEIEENRRQLSYRDKELDSIISAMVEIQEMFKEFNEMVIKQGDLIDRIDVNIDKTQDNVKEAVYALKIAEATQTSCRYISLLLVLCKCIFKTSVIYHWDSWRCNTQDCIEINGIEIKFIQ